DEAEAYFEERLTTALEVRDQQIEALTSAATRGLGLRVLVGGASGYLFSTEPKPKALAGLARRAVALAREAEPDPLRALPDLAASPAANDLQIFDPALAEVSTERKLELLRTIEQVARSEDERVENTELARYSDTLANLALANSCGLAVSYQRSSAFAALV